MLETGSESTAKHIPLLPAGEQPNEIAVKTALNNAHSQEYPTPSASDYHRSLFSRFASGFDGEADDKLKVRLVDARQCKVSYNARQESACEPMPTPAEKFLGGFSLGGRDMPRILMITHWRPKMQVRRGQERY